MSGIRWRAVLLTVGVTVMLVAPAWGAEGKPITLTARVVDAVCLLDPLGPKPDIVVRSFEELDAALK